MENESQVKTLIMASDMNEYPNWVLPVTSLMNNMKKYNPSISDIILEARGLLACKYSWRGREMDVAETLGKNNSERTSAEINQTWDEYNSFYENLKKHEYEFSNVAKK